MKILYYAPNPHLSLNAQTGYGTHMREMINAWKSMGHEVEPFIAGDLSNSVNTKMQHSSSSLKKLVKNVIPNYFWESEKDRRLIKLDAQLAEKLNELVIHFNPDIIYERISYLQSSGIQVARKNGTRHISEINAPFPEERIYFSGKSSFLKKAKAMEQKILKDSDCITVVSSALRNYLLKIDPAIGTKIHVIPNAVNESLAKIQVERTREIRSQFKLEGHTVIGFVGSIFPYHGVDLLIDAFSQLKDKIDTRLLIVGDGESIPQLKDFARQNKLQDRVVFTGSVLHREVFHYIEIMDICCMMNSNWYGSPVKIFEYGLMGKAVIAPDVIPVRDVMTHGKDGLLVKNSLDEISSSLNKLVEDKQLREELASSWKNKVIGHFTWNKAAQKTLDLCT